LRPGVASTASLKVELRGRDHVEVELEGDVRLSRGQQLGIVLGVWIIAALAASADVETATSASALITVVLLGILLALMPKWRGRTPRS
jgi:hypothetical protein